jgi:hypothetical protein
MEQGIFFMEQGIFDKEQGIFSSEQGILIAILFRSAFGSETTKNSAADDNLKRHDTTSAVDMKLQSRNARPGGARSPHASLPAPLRHPHHRVEDLRREAFVRAGAALDRVPPFRLVPGFDHARLQAEPREASGQVQPGSAGTVR